MVRSTFLNLHYQVNRRLAFSAILPVRLVTAPKDIRPNERVTRRFKGLGDLLVRGNYQLNLPEKAARPAFAAQFGLRLPTGKSQPDHTWAGSLSRDPVLQTGYGTVDPLLGVSCYQQWGRPALSANVLTRLSGGENRYGLKFSSELQGGAGLSRSFSASRFLSSFLSGAQLGLRLHGVKSGHDYDRGKVVSNTGGQWLYLLPAINLETKSGVAYFLQFQLPVYQNVNGGQLVAPYGFTTGISFTPFRRRERAELAQAPLPDGAEPELISRGESVNLEQHLAVGRGTVFEFYADWCSVCRRLDPLLKRRLAGRQEVVLKRGNISDGETAVSKQYAITTTPTFYVYGVTGQLVKTFSTDEPSKLEAVINVARTASTRR